MISCNIPLVPLRLGQDVAGNELAHSYTTFNTCYKVGYHTTPYQQHAAMIPSRNTITNLYLSQDTGLFGIYLVAPDNKLDDAMWYTLDNLVRLCYNVTDEEVARAKTQLKANLYASCAQSKLFLQCIHTYSAVHIYSTYSAYIQYIFIYTLHTLSTCIHTVHTYTQNDSISKKIHTCIHTYIHNSSMQIHIYNVINTYIHYIHTYIHT